MEEIGKFFLILLAITAGILIILGVITSLVYIFGPVPSWNWGGIIVFIVILGAIILLVKSFSD